MDLIFGRAVFDRDVLALDKACFLQALAERGHEVPGVGKRRTAEQPDYRHRRLLRARLYLLYDPAAPEKRDELASPHSVTRRHGRARAAKRPITDIANI